MTPEYFRRAIRFFYPALYLERVMPFVRLRRMSRIVTLFLVAALILWGAGFALSFLPANRTLSLANVVLIAREIAGSVFLFLLSIRLILLAGTALFFSFYFINDVQAGAGNKENADRLPHFDTAFIAFISPRGNLLRGFAASALGRETFIRCGITPERIDSFIAVHEPTLDHMEIDARRANLSPNISASDGIQRGIFEPSDIARELAVIDRGLADLLQRSGVTREDFVATARWVERRKRNELARLRWWSRSQLKLVPSIGEEWSYGGAYALRRFSTDLEDMPVFHAVDLATQQSEDETLSLETILARAREANALLIGEDSTASLNVVARLAKKIAMGEVVEPLRHKRVLVLRTAEMVAGVENKSALEQILMKLFSEAASAGNIVLLIENFPAFIESARGLGVDAVSIIEPYLRADTIQLAVTANPEQFHASVGGNVALAERFEQIFVKPLGAELIIRLLEDRAIEREQVSPLIFTYPSLEEIARSADQYFAYGIMPDKAFDLLFEMESYALQDIAHTGPIVTREIVRALISKKTGIPGGAILADERRKLLGLKDALRKRVVGQDTAVEAVGDALIRARSGLADSERPIGTFLFLGPTGVGKTETAKALAYAYFGSEQTMLRIDLSEYNTADALDRLIGSFSDGRPGILASMVREHPYGVLLLDEFEKTRPEVHDLFLQIFDEGMFSDARGKRVSARNLIIIATSNAASDLIWQLAEQGEDLVARQRELIDAVIARGVFKPELINRFDEVVVYRPLDQTAIRAIARIMLNELASRIREKGIELTITEELIDVLVREGYDPQFGARPMRRALTDMVEQAVALRMVSGTAEPGSTVTLTRADLQRFGNKHINASL